MRYKIVRTQKLIWYNIIRLTKSQKASVLYYSIDVFPFMWKSSFFISLSFNQSLNSNFLAYKIISTQLKPMKYYLN